MVYYIRPVHDIILDSFVIFMLYICKPLLILLMCGWHYCLVSAWYFYYLQRGGCVLALVCLLVGCCHNYYITKTVLEDFRDVFGLGRLWDKEQYFGSDLNIGF